MKQHITVEQVWELSRDLGLDGEPEWDSIVNFNTFMGYEWNLTEEENAEYTFQKCCEDTARWTTIGKMIEILQNNGVEIIIEWTITGWSLDFVNKDYELTTIKQQELCDALWEAVVQIL